MMDFCTTHHHKNSTKEEVLQVVLMKVYDVNQEPPELFLQQYFHDVFAAITAADKMVKKDPKLLYMVFRDDTHVVYMR